MKNQLQAILIAFTFTQLHETVSISLDTVDKTANTSLVNASVAIQEVDPLSLPNFHNITEEFNDFFHDLTDDGAQKCYEGLGCFPQTSDWRNVRRPFPSPHSPELIDTRLYQYTRTAPERFNVVLRPDISIEGSSFDPSKRTICVTHGFASNGNVTWLDDLKNALLTNVDANVFIVDWGKGASHFNYLQVAANTRVVGAEVARFVQYLITEKGVKPNDVYLIGHSLGSHIMGYVGKRILRSRNLTGEEKSSDQFKIGRITGLDPAQPGFEGASRNVRLDKQDAKFVDICHSDAKPFIPTFGFGFISPIGHVDFYLNQGTLQPNCIDFAPIRNVRGIVDLGKVTVEVLASGVSCSHGRAYQVFTAAINPNVTCAFEGKKIISNNFLRDAGILGTPIVAKKTCSAKDCVKFGLAAEKSKVRGLFQVKTSGIPPYCCNKESFLFGCSN